MQTNYDKQVQIAQDLFLKYDQDELIKKYDLEHDTDYLYLVFLGDMCRISRKSGEIEVNDKAAGAFVPCSDYNVVMTLYDVLCYPQGTPALADEWRPLEGLQVTMSSPSADVFNQKYADAFAGNIDRLLHACQKIGGMQPRISAGADVCWQFEIFPFFPLQFRFWDQDDEFPAQIRLLWDRNSLKFMHFETLYYAMGHLMHKLLTVFELNPS